MAMIKFSPNTARQNNQIMWPYLSYLKTRVLKSEQGMWQLMNCVSKTQEHKLTLRYDNG